jgi:site-specific DNA-methyltransferase (adenine-specific)
MNLLLNHDRFALIQGEALATLRTLPSKSVDAIITDPPYAAHVHANLGKERRSDGHAIRDELEFPPIDAATIAQLAAEFVRLSRGWIIVFSDFFQSGTWGQAIQAAVGAWIRTGAWVKTTPMPQMTGDRPAVGHEDIVIAHAVGKGMTWNGRGHAATWRGTRDSDAEHPNQKPAWLMQALAGMFAPAGGLVLDPFLGSGTTAYAALAPGRIEREVPAETYCAKCAAKRAAEYAPPLPVGVRVLGIEGDPKWTAYAIERCAPLLGITTASAA